MGRFRLSNSSRMSKVNKILPLSAAYVNAGQRLIVANEEGTPQLTDGYQLSTNVICGQVVEIADRDGYKGILVDDSSGLIVLKDYKEDREPLQIGDFIKAFGGMRKPKGAENGNLYFTPYEISLKVLEQIVGQLNFSKRGSSTANNAGAQKMETSKGSTDVNTGFNILPLGNGVTADHNKVLGVVYKIEAEEGANVPADFNHLGMSEKKVRDLLQFLADEGH